MANVYFSIGSNLGDKLANIHEAIDLISLKAGRLVSCSNIYETPPLGFDSNSLFYNVCIQVSTKNSVEDVLGLTQDIERQIGRKEKSNNGVYASRLIDIDIIFYDQLILKSAFLTVPHERFTERRFVLKPLNDINPSLIDPLSKKTIKELLSECKDESVLTRLD
jgi:2-amino-4-hydroxy-6-hydroxymethyldihydropteridine diphosphokinase